MASAGNPSGPLLSPVAMLSMARNFAMAAAALQEGQHVAPAYHPVTHYLYGHAIELGLKAYLVARGWDGARLRSELGHNLDDCVTAARAAGLEDYVTLSGEEMMAIALLNEAYEAKDLEYAGETTPGGAMIRLPTTQLLDGIADRLQSRLRKPCLDALNAMRGRAAS